MMRSRRTLLCLFALTLCFQLTGLQEAFCEDSAMEADCQECVTCVGQQFTQAAEPMLPPSIVFSGYLFQHYSFQTLEHPPLGLLRPPITR